MAKTKLTIKLSLQLDALLEFVSFVADKNWKKLMVNYTDKLFLLNDFI